jgi:sigma-B regulation protein RsbU (phosphoserine phosphatase)
MELATRYIAGERGLKVGGDFFDVFRLASNDWGIVLGDVCGRGARPASLAMLARWSIRAASVREFKPSDVLRDVNGVFVADNVTDRDDQYCSALFARLQLDTCGAWLTVANAGHPAPILVRRSGRVELRTEPSFPIGLFDSIDPTDDRVGLGPGDALVFYTDGISEARDGSGETFGEDRLVAELTGWTGEPADVIADKIIDAAQRFAGGRLDDDVALLVVRVPDDAHEDRLARLSVATGVPIDHLELPGYPH